MRIASGVIDQVVYFFGPSGLSGFTVNRSRNGSAFTPMTTPTVIELGSTGVYTLLLDEDMTIGSGNVTEAMVFLVQAGGMTDQLLQHELFETGNYVVGTVTVNTDMRGTNGANTVAPDNAGVAVVQAKTDQLIFTVAGKLDANAQYMNDTLLIGTGIDADKFRGSP